MCKKQKQATKREAEAQKKVERNRKSNISNIEHT